ncbi:hypothetical protein BV898_19885, partial [Hypsibius exemplaris]
MTRPLTVSFNRGGPDGFRTSATRSLYQQEPDQVRQPSNTWWALPTCRRRPSVPCAAEAQTTHPTNFTSKGLNFHTFDNSVGAMAKTRSVDRPPVIEDAHRLSIRI